MGIREESRARIGELRWDRIERVRIGAVRVVRWERIVVFREVGIESSNPLLDKSTLQFRVANLCARRWRLEARNGGVGDGEESGVGIGGIVLCLGRFWRRRSLGCLYLGLFIGLYLGLYLGLCIGLCIGWYRTGSIRVRAIEVPNRIQLSLPSSLPVYFSRRSGLILSFNYLRCDRFLLTLTRCLSTRRLADRYRSYSR